MLLLLLVVHQSTHEIRFVETKIKSGKCLFFVLFVRSLEPQCGCEWKQTYPTSYRQPTILREKISFIFYCSARKIKKKLKHLEWSLSVRLKLCVGRKFNKNKNFNLNSARSTECIIINVLHTQQWIEGWKRVAPVNWWKETGIARKPNQINGMEKISSLERIENNKYLLKVDERKFHLVLIFN